MKTTHSDIVLSGLSAQIDVLHEKSFGASHPRYLQIGEIGRDCERSAYLWLHWASTPKPPEGDRVRAMKRGRREEDLILDDLIDAGVVVSSRDTQTGRQYQVTAMDGHAMGFIDAAGNDPKETYVSGKKWFVIELKALKSSTYNTIMKKGVQAGAAKHYATMVAYMHLTGMSQAVYGVKNKDTDELRFIQVKEDPVYAKALIERGERIVFRSVVPPPISTDPSFFTCSFCDQRDVCFGRALPLRNCRTCRFVKASPGGVWDCTIKDRALSMDEQKVGCDDHRFLPTMLRAQEIDVDTATKTVTYKLDGGAEFIDQGPTAIGVDDVQS
jgi:hypothetical protein